ncbi:MAG: tetratricopeptide repeat-containing sulfotransferase family protein [Alphaproteobacteria bacterium]
MNEAEFRAAATEAFQRHRAGRLDEAEIGYRGILEARPDTPEILQLLGTLLGQAGRLDDAHTTLKHATRLQPENAEAQYNLAECLFQLDELAAAGNAYRAALAARPDHVEAAIGLSGLLLGDGEATEAADVTHNALTHTPNHPLLLAQLGAALLDADDPATARTHLETAVRQVPDHKLARRNLAAALIKLEEFAPALELLRPLVNAEPRSVDLLLLAGVALHKSGQHARAKPAAGRALEIDADNVAAINLLGDIAVSLGDGDLALDCARRAAALVPNGADEAAALAERLERLSLLDEADEWAARARTLAPENTLARMIEARLLRRAGDAAGSLALLDQIDTSVEENGLAANILFERGQLLEAIDRHGEAFEAFENAHAKRAMTWHARARDPGKHADTQETLLALFESDDAADRTASWSNDIAADTLTAPSFLVGHPRSGTTLVERLLDAHDRVTATPELPMVDAMRNALDTAKPAGFGYPEALTHIGTEDVGRLRSLYWETLKDSHAETLGERHVVDKHPLNLDHLGLIARTFPHAKVVVSLRDPRDVCISCFTTDFAANNVTVRFRDLQETARAYAATMRLWLRYRDILPLETFTYRYEDLVDDPRAVLTQVVTFLELDWHDELLNSAGTNVGRYISTPSYTGVTEGVNARAVGRWKGYAKQLEPVMPLLQPYIEAFGYDNPDQR